MKLFLTAMTPTAKRLRKVNAQGTTAIVLGNDGG